MLGKLRWRSRLPGAPKALAPTVAGALALTILALSGCGGSSDNGIAAKLPDEILQTATSTAQAAKSVHIKSESSQRKLKSSADLQLSKAGGRGKISFFGLDFELIRIGQSVYVKGSQPFYERLQATVGKLPKIPQGSWLKGSASSGPLAQLAAFTDMGGELDRLLSTPGSLSKGPKKTVNGQQAISLTERTKVYEASLYVASTGKPYPIEQVKGGHGREQGRTSYSQWDEPVSLSAPSDVVVVGG